MSAKTWENSASSHTPSSCSCQRTSTTTDCRLNLALDAGAGKDGRTSPSDRRALATAGWIRAMGRRPASRVRLVQRRPASTVRLVRRRPASTVRRVGRVRRVRVGLVRVRPASTVRLVRVRRVGRVPLVRVRPASTVRRVGRVRPPPAARSGAVGARREAASIAMPCARQARHPSAVLPPNGDRQPLLDGERGLSTQHHTA